MVLYCDLQVFSIAASAVFFFTIFYPFTKSYALDHFLKDNDKDHVMYCLKISRIFFCFYNHKEGKITKAAFWFSIKTYLVYFIYSVTIILLLCFDNHWSYILRLVFAAILFIYIFIEQIYLELKYDHFEHSKTDKK